MLTMSQMIISRLGRQTGYAPHTLAMVALIMLLGTVFGLGGSANANVPVLQILRPISVLCLGIGLATLQRKHIHGYRQVLGLAFFAAALPALQLVPLPPEVWNTLPGRELLVQIDQAAGLEGVWRSVSLTPAATLNALGASLVPLAVLVLTIQLPPRQRAALVAVPIAFGVMSALLGVLQLLGGARSEFYFYDITNYNSPVGLFANRNHQSVALACLIPLGLAASYMFRTQARRSRTWKSLSLVLMLLGLGALLSLILVTGSRAGLIVTIAALASVFLVLPLRSQLAAHSIPKPRIGMVLGAVTLLVITAVAVLQDRDVALARLLGSSPGDDLRVQLLTTLQQMIADYGLWGAGLGSFERVYQLYEPAHLLAPTYVNHAHNDWIELIITGGMPAIVLLLVSVAIIITRAIHLLTLKEGDSFQPLRFAGFVCIGLLALASISDYPLRTPYLAGLLALSITWLFTPVCQAGKHGWALAQKTGTLGRERKR